MNDIQMNYISQAIFLDEIDHAKIPICEMNWTRYSWDVGNRLTSVC